MSVIHSSSTWLRKVLGLALALILFLIWMSLSGVLLNHPDLIAGVSAPRWLVPSQYHPQNWNRSGIVSGCIPAPSRIRRTWLASLASTKASRAKSRRSHCTRACQTRYWLRNQLARRRRRSQGRLMPKWLVRETH